ncbi:hypothetical protein IEQ34_004030 [Dendrobium chrysotoxum]|uniref:Uncharacterized protein n=1 Tax=Dendrobium chrysotoxum TaxID=161865 RepID=A0AAV7HER8_DENCH|nr:hypothetical protein IEQ34_004030 [Dendrobium chrysotoxum]
MVLTRIVLFNRLISSRTIPISLDPISHLGFCPVFVVDPSPFLLNKGVFSLAAADSNPTKSKSLSSIFANPSADSQSKKLPCRNDANAKKEKIEENKLPQIGRSFRFCSLQEKKFPEELSPEAALLLKRLQEELYLKLEPGQIPANLPSRHLLRLAAEKLGQRHQEIAKFDVRTAVRNLMDNKRKSSGQRYSNGDLLESLDSSEERLDNNLEESEQRDNKDILAKSSGHRTGISGQQLEESG